MQFYKKFIINFSLLFLLVPPQVYATKKISADYLIVGVGTAGGLLAKRLSDDHQTSVIAFNIGEDLSDNSLVKLSKNGDITVNMAPDGPPLYQSGVTTPQTDADNRQLPWGIGVIEGGGSSVNGMAYCRGTDQCYAGWEAIAGPEWSVKQISKIFKELETYDGETPNPATRGKRGPVNVRQNPHPSRVSKTFTRATIKATGYPYLLDYNDPKTPIGSASKMQFTQDGIDGRLRVSSVTAFLNDKVVTSDGKGVDGRKLQIILKSVGLKTIWKGNKAIGVEYLHEGKIKKAYAKKKVIVCCGLKSSQFLLVSGIGPRALLKSLDIPVVFDNPNVGQGLMDQPGLQLMYSSNPDDTKSIRTPDSFQCISWLPDMNGDQNVREFRFAVTTILPSLNLAVFSLVQPRSRGSITINSKDPLAPPIVNLGVLSSPKDVALFQSGLQTYVKNISETVQKIDSQYRLISPDPAIFDDPVLTLNFIKENVRPTYHFQGHCRMAPIDQGGVVDSEGHVYGVKNLVVADDSINPISMDGNTMASAYLVAENIARMLLQK